MFKKKLPVTGSEGSHILTNVSFNIILQSASRSRSGSHAGARQSVSYVHFNIIFPLAPVLYTRPAHYILLDQCQAESSSFRNYLNF